MERRDSATIFFFQTCLYSTQILLISWGSPAVGTKSFQPTVLTVQHFLCYFTTEADVIPRGALIYFLFGLNALIPLANLESQLPGTSDSPPAQADGLSVTVPEFDIIGGHVIMPTSRGAFRFALRGHDKASRAPNCDQSLNLDKDSWAPVTSH